MDKAVIIGVYEFLGFHFCLHFLENGIEVIGIHPNNDDEEQDFFLEEKRMLVGRNGNFFECDFANVKSDEFIGNTYIFIDYYSYYIKRAEKEIMEKLFSLTCHDQIKIVLLLPVQLCLKSNKSEVPVFQRQEQDKHITSFYLPTIYGPWQPVQYSLQQSFLNPDMQVKLDDREWTEDALYINDVIKTIFKAINDEQSKNYMLKSNIKSHWHKLTSYFGNIHVNPKVELIQFEHEILILDVDDPKITQGVEEQKRHLMKLLERKI